MSDSRLAPPPTTYDEFTESGYRTVLELASRRYAFEPFDTTVVHPHVLWRHDVDMSVHRALALARIEADLGVRSTWFIWLRSPFYSLLDRATAERARAILELGHRLGLHFDAGAYGPLRDEGELERRIAYERRLLEDLLKHPVCAVSLHNPDVLHCPGMRNDRLAGLPNAYGLGLESAYEYVSDSNGFWRYRRLPEALADETITRLHVLTHPEWWTPEPLSPRERVVRAVEGRGRHVLNEYDALLARHDRINLR
jgi:hypothetical protein